MSIAHFEGRKTLIVFCITVFLTAALLVSGCKRNENNPVDNSAATTVSDDAADAADAVSEALASNNGGAMDQVNDVFEIAGGVGVGGGVLGRTTADASLSGAKYDSTTMSWTLILVKGDSVQAPLYYTYCTRDYWLQFRANGQPQKLRNTNGVVADTIKHKLTGGSGYFRTPRLVHHLLSIGSDWIASNTNTNTVTINGTYFRSGVDTIKVTGRNGRVLSDSISLIFENVTGPRGTRLARSEETTGTIIVFYTAEVTTAAGVKYSVTKSFTIVLSGGDATFSIDGFRFVSDLASGDH